MFIKSIAFSLLVCCSCSSYAAWTVISEVPSTSHIAKSSSVQVVSSAPAGATPVGYIEVNGNAQSTADGCAAEVARRAQDLGAVAVVVHPTEPMTLLKSRCIGVAYGAPHP